MDMSKYDVLSTDSLIRAIQRTARLLDSKEAKKMASNRSAALQRDLHEMRMVVIPRLKEENRNTARFFRTGTYILYSKYQPPSDVDDWSPRASVPDKHGVVTGHVDGKVLVQFEGEQFSTLCWPQDLKIKYIR